MKKKKILIGVSSVLVLIVGIFFYLYVSKDNGEEIYVPKKEEVKTQISGFNGLSLMYETGPGTGEYQESKSSTWPEEGYIFNENLSACENGGKLSWNEEKKAVILNSFGSDACYVYFDAYIIPVINSVSTSNITNDSITLTVNATNGNNPITTYYYSSNNGSNYIESTSNTYTFNNLEMGTEYNFSVYVKDSLGYESEPYTLSEATTDILLADWVISQYNGVQGNNGIYHHQNLANSAEDGSYRYAGANPNNYVCFGANASTCPSDNLYRIIGVFGSEVKLIKADYSTTSQTGTTAAYYDTYFGMGYNRNYYKGFLSTSSIGVYYWNLSENNTWSSSNLTITNLNNIFYNSFADIWKNKITDATWYVGGYNTNNATPSIWFKAESTGLTWVGKIGLIYISDYGYATIPDYWITNMSSYNSVSSNNWIHMGLYEWSISRRSNGTTYAYYLDEAGSVQHYLVHRDDMAFAIRPCFYLTSSTTYVSGTGTQSDPIRIN